MNDHTYTLKTISPTDLAESPVLRGKHFLEQFAALPFRASALGELSEPAILDYLHRHPMVVEERKRKKKKSEREKGKGTENKTEYLFYYIVTGNLRSAALISCLNPETPIPVLVESPPIPTDILLTEVIERELLNLSLMAMQTGGYSKAISSLFRLMKKFGSASSIFPTKSRLSQISGVNRREI
ncbi:hypothetical protein [Marinobacter salsuginis]|uniref:hypothetical protein n=1 Tax=Marinobacter salsuginis TaxID=418719 RepID=UPI001AE00E5B|nr:hypothetical protein [Marinobacter salsuginis]QTN42157.1 hypothetical protein HZ997_01920 [Marinobacter salsuginis]